MKCKSTLRRTVIQRRDALPPREIRRRSARVAELLFSLPEIRSAGTIMFFVAFGSEVDTVPMMQQALRAGKRVLAPRADPVHRGLAPCQVLDLDRDLAVGAHGIREPVARCPAVALDEIEAVIVPAAVWSEDGYRIGYGGGYYDRFLPKIPRAVRIGLGFELQVVPEVPHGEHDLPVDLLVTEAKVRRWPGRKRGR